MATKKVTPAQIRATKNVAKRDALDKKFDKQRGIKQGSKKDVKLDKKNKVFDFEYGGKKEKY